MIVKVREIRRAGFLAWAGLSLIVLFVLAASFVLSPAGARELVPECGKKARGAGECPLCGMTTSFTHVAAGDFAAAQEANRMGVLLFFLLALNELACLSAVALHARRGRALFAGRESHADC